MYTCSLPSQSNQQPVPGCNTYCILYYLYVKLTTILDFFSRVLFHFASMCKRKKPSYITSKIHKPRHCLHQLFSYGRVGKEWKTINVYTRTTANWLVSIYRKRLLSSGGLKKIATTWQLTRKNVTKGLLKGPSDRRWPHLDSRASLIQWKLSKAAK